jgi:hypothetical protein
MERFLLWSWMFVLLTMVTVRVTVTAQAEVIKVTGSCTLPDAIRSANSDMSVGGCSTGTGMDTIELDNGDITLNQTLDLASGPTGLPAIISEITIKGNGVTVQRLHASESSCSAQDPTAPFRIFYVAQSGNLTLNDITISHGCTPSGDSGGGILNEGRLTLSNTTVSNNKARTTTTGGKGGGILNRGGTLTLQAGTVIRNNEASEGGGIHNTDEAVTELETRKGVTRLKQVIVSGNSAVFGGGISNELGTLEVTDSTISSNMAVDGAGIANASQASITSSTISGNTATCVPSEFNGCFGGEGGGINNSQNFFNERPLTIINSTISNNEAKEGGGIYNNGDLVLTNVTVTANKAFANEGAGLGTGTGPSPSVMVKNTVIARNTTGQDCLVDNPSTYRSLGNNLDSDGTCRFNAMGDRTVPDLILGQLQNNRGSTFTHALPPNSPAIDTGDNAMCPPTDQRGVLRPQPPGGRCDIGAYERVQTVDLSLTVTPPEPAILGENLSYKFSVTNRGFTGATDVAVTYTPPQQRLVRLPGRDPVLVRGNVLFRQGFSSVGCEATPLSTVVCQLGNLAIGETQEATIVVTPTGAGQIENRLIATAMEGPSTSSDNSVVFPAQVRPPAQNPTACRTIPALTDFPPPADPRQAYVLVGSPLNLSASNPAGADPRTALETFGRFLQRAWLLFRFDSNPALPPDLGEYRKFSPGDADFNFTVGRGFWLITRNGGMLAFSGAPNDSQLFGIDLAPGPTPQQIATPFNFPPGFSIDWSGCVVPILQALEIPVKSFLCGYTGEGQGPKGQGYSIEEIMQPMFGYWVFNEAGTPVTLPISPECVMLNASSTPSPDGCLGESTATIPIVAQQALTDVPSPKLSSALLGWRLKLSASVGTIADTDNYLGTDVIAQDGPDALDYPEPPPIHGLTLSFPHPEWNAGWAHYTTDIRGISGEKPQTWDFEVVTDTPNVQVQLSWSFSGMRGKSLTLRDIDNSQIVKMRETSRYTYNTESRTVRHFRIVTE